MTGGGPTRRQGDPHSGGRPSPRDAGARDDPRDAGAWDDPHGAGANDDPRDADAWDDPHGAETYDDVIRRGALYPALAVRLVERLVDRGALPLGARALDLACGTGIVSGKLLARAGRDGIVVGLDAARAMLAVAARAMPVDNAAFAAGDPRALPFSRDAFDAVTCSAAFWHFPGPPAVFAEIARVLRPGGRFAFNVPAAQLAGVDDLPPAPFQLALAREGERVTGVAPAPGGPVRRRDELLADAAAAGFEVEAEDVDDHAVPQRELIDLLAVPAIGARMWPQLPARAFADVVAAAAGRVEGEDGVQVRWVGWVLRWS